MAQQAHPRIGQDGSIILIDSSANATGASGLTAYGASKAAVRNLAQTWAEDRKCTASAQPCCSPGASCSGLE